ncbi:hypothetical protein RDWZM_007101 [Blomia tropicalis]|uniref:EF-hand domain-containing protein n=1 Tax=Blomia tropicalis TaxID=40697 RepID=A0A9Q0RNZ7_BLOTA|nr:hypothetical protein RDWZM_007101 [Blomia tropicalis]
MKDQQQQQDSSHSSLEASLDSIGFGAPIRVPNLDVTNLPKPVEFSISKLEPDGGAPSGEYLYNTIAFVVYCEKHNRIALCFNERSEATWLPFIASPQNKTWHDATQDGISIIFSKEDSELDARLTTLMPIQSIFSLHILRIQLPISQKFIYRLIQLVKLGENTDQFKCCQTSKRLHWVNLQDGMNGNVDKLWGPEVVFYSSYVQTLKQQEIFEVGLDQTYAMLPKDGVKHTLEQEMLVSVNITQQVLEKLYSEFLEHCFPSYYMTYTSFQSYMMELLPEYQLKESETMVLQMFHGYDSKRNGYIGFEDYLLGLVAMDPNCTNNETRFRLIFRYYDLDQDNMLNADEFRSLLMDLQLSDRSLQQQMVQIIENGIELANFISMCKDGSLKEHINRPCRFAFSPISRICDGFVKRNEQRIIASKRNDNILNQSNKSRGLCLACRDKKYQFGMHCVRLEPSGRCVEPRHLPDYDTESFDEKSDEISVDKYSQDYVFSTVSIGHTFLDMIRDFNTAKGNCQKPNGFLATPDYRDIFIQYLTILCQNVRSLFECEDKLIKINSPAFVIGDIRGNLENLLLMERILWQQVPVVSNNFVFLGNYVNVGKWSIECVLYLFALKIIAPNKFFLIRGFNEVRSSQKAGLQQECLSKYGTKHGTKVWEMVNDVFDRMCLMVVIDEAILCVNSGVPSQTPKLEDLFKMTSTLKDPLLDPIARDILNINRGAEDSILDYMKQNGLSHLIRGNQVLQDGYQLSGNGKILNVFSCSHYCGKKNDLAVICVDHPKIRVVKLDTSKCQPAT